MGIDHVHLHVSDMGRALRFYGQGIGATEAFRAGDKLVFLRLPGGGTVVLDSRSERERNPPHFGVDVGQGADLERAVAPIEDAGGRVIERGEHQPGMPYVYAADPDGNVLEL